MLSDLLERFLVGVGMGKVKTGRLAFDVEGMSEVEESDELNEAVLIKDEL